MADAESSDESSSSSQSNETSGGSSQEETPSRGSVGRKKIAQYDDEQASPEHSSTNITNKSVKDKNKVSLKSISKKTVQQHNKNPKKVNRENRETPSQLKDEFDNRDIQKYHNLTAGGPAAKCDSPSHVEKNNREKTKTKVSDRRQGKTLNDVDLESRSSNSKTKNNPNENELNYFDSEYDITRENSATRNHGISDHPPKLEERTNKKERTSTAASESLGSETTKSDSDTAKHEHKKGKSKRKMTDEGSVSSIKGHKSSSSNNHANLNNNSKDHRDENRIRDMRKTSVTDLDDKKDGLQRSTCQKGEKSEDKIDDRHGHDLHRGSNNATQGACETNKKKHSKKSDPNKKNAIDKNNRKSSDRSRSCSSSCSSSSKNHDKNTSSSLGAGRGVESHGGSSSRSSTSGSSENSSQNCASNSQGCHKGTDKTTTDNRSKKSQGKKETDSDRALKTGRREDRGERPWDRKSKESHNKKETDSGRASDTSRREVRSERTSDRSERPSVRKSNKSDDKKETDSKRASETSRREDSSDSSSYRSKRHSDRKSNKFHDKKETDEDRTSKASHRGDRSKRTSDRNSKKCHNGEEVEYKKKTKGDRSRKDGKKDERNAKRRADSSGSSSERRRSRSKEKSRDKERHREKGKYEQMDEESERYHSNNSYNREKNREKRENFSARHYSRDHSEEEEWNRERKSKASSKDSGKYRDSPKINERNRRKYYDEDSNEREAKYEQPNYKYVWQFENEHGNWITYGQSNTGRPLQGAGATTSDDIEEFYSKHRGTKKPLLIEANNNQYFLDFIEMSQTNVKTSVCRKIRRVRLSEKHNYQGQKYNEDYHHGDGRASSNFGRLSGHPPDPKDNQPTRKSDSSTKFEWQFEDETTGHWITYGKTNSARDRNTGSSTTSDDIEKFHARDPSEGTMLIRSGRDQYLLNFKQMTEVNIETHGRRRVRRVAKSSGVLQLLVNWLSGFSLSGSRDTDVDKYEWQFQDERGVWITYGQASSNGITAFSTAASSDDIETYYLNNPDKAPIIISSRTHTYVLDFSKMVQINQETLVQRPIRRVKKTLNGSKTNQQGVGQSGVTAGNGTNAGVNNFPNPSHNPAYVGYGAGNASHSFNQRDPRVNVGAGQHLNHPSFPCVWQFQDENGSWITYGQPSSTNQTAGSTTTSDDIEQYFSTNPGQNSMIIQSPSNQYVLDFQSMVQINQQTQAQKPVRRVMKQNIQSPPNFQQGF